MRDPLNADIQNYIGYAYRRQRQLGPAIEHYQQALMLNPRHRSAHEHLGEAYLVLGEPAKAEQLLTALENLCLIPCEEYDDLQRALAAHKKLAARWDQIGRRRSAFNTSDRVTYLRVRDWVDAVEKFFSHC